MGSSAVLWSRSWLWLRKGPSQEQKGSGQGAMEEQGAGLAKRLGTLLSGLLECMCFAGVIFGWASLVYVLKDMHYFEELCVPAANGTGNGTQGPDCRAQDEQLSLVFTVGSFMNNFMTFPTGYIFDRFGTVPARLLAISLYTGGTLLIAFSTAATALILFPAMCLLSIGGILLILTNMQVGNLFGKHRSTIITLYNGAFDSSSAVFLVVKLLYEQGLTLRAMFLFLSACSAWHLTRTFFLMPRWHIPYPLPPGYTYGLRCQRQGSSYRTHEEQRPGLGDGAHEPSDPCSEPGPGDADASKALKGKGESGAGPGHGELPGMSFRACVFSKLFFWHLMWLSVMQLRHYLFIGTLNPMLEHLAAGDTTLVSTYTNAFAFTQLCGVLCAPWNGLILDRHKRGRSKDGSAKGGSDSLADLHSCILSLAVTVLQCVAFSVCASVPVLPVQYATFILQVLSRSFLYGGNAAFLAIAFPLEHFGKLYGLVMGLSALVSLLQYPCFALIKGPLSDDPFYVNIGLIIVILLAFVSPLVVLREYQRREREQEKQHVDSPPLILAKAGVESSI
ncbi:solute carrier family 43 member 3 isoform X2 [Trachemys scripta elegans]|uniref:solute carrier family 43 member 3 isoform X1 n=2 Tax=Trachemys scripta elegans TaxID=31138 RepID=UPI001555C34B|nr:solute carrier family 43 member 3 isoform X1 [Trachemys scripta elegans]XP_034618090.1 solute carrier family 43 member 3 isoform X2 [Trachemys scripta elegans]